MKLNLGAGEKPLAGYTNVDFRQLPGIDRVVDLSKLPWPWETGTVDEVVMLDFLEHFPYKKTESILQECWRIMKLGGKITVQVPDLKTCAAAASAEGDYLCNRCGTVPEGDRCPKCEQSTIDIALAATHRLFGGQDYEGNWHHHAFTEFSLSGLLQRNGFHDCEFPQMNENGETYFQNWNICVKAVKGELAW